MGITWMESVTMIKNKTHVTAYSDNGDSNTTSGSKPADHDLSPNLKLRKIC